MLLAIDIGNTNVVIGCFDRNEIVAEMRFKTDAGRTVDEHAVLLFTMLDRKLPKGYQFDTCIVSSVVPPVTPDLIRVVEEHLSITPLVVGPGIKTGLPIKISDPSAVGADRVVNSVAAKVLFGTPALVVDFGTATSFDYVSKEGNYEGGVIAPGVNTSIDALVRNTAKLPRIELAWPKSVIGKNTVQAMQAGSVVGYQCMVDGLIDRIVDEVGPIPHVIATGGLGRLFAGGSRRITKFDGQLTLKGMQILATMNAQS